MSCKTVWECDRCGAHSDGDEDTDATHPDGWEEQWGHDLCAACCASLDDLIDGWLQGGKPPATPETE